MKFYTVVILLGAVGYGSPSVVINYNIIEHGTSQGSKRELEMSCDITRSNNTSPSDVTYDVYVYIDNDIIKSFSGKNCLTPDDMPVRISEADLRIGATLTCELYARNRKCYGTPGSADNTAITSLPIIASHYLGFEVLSNNLVAYEGGNPLKYEIRPTIPILYPVGSEDCEMFLTPVLKSLSQSPAVCSDGTPIDQLVYGSSLCGISIGMTMNTTVTYSIDLAAAKDGIYDGDHDMEISFETPESHPFHSLWQNYRLQQTNITIKDNDSPIAGKVCVAINDPHMITFDGQHYEHQLEGEFVLYRHTSQPIEVQAYFKRCSYNAAACVCGVAIRAGGQLFIYDHCRDHKPQRVRLYECEGEGLNVEPLPGNGFRIHLPTGGAVEVHETQIKVYPSASDIGRTEGLCGTLNDERADDFMQRDGVVQRVTTTGYYTYPLAFSNSWRVPANESLYVGKLPLSHTDTTNTSKTTIFCTCHRNNVTNMFESQCGSMGETAVQFCTGQPKKETSKHSGRCLNRKKRALGTLTDDIDDDVALFQYDVNFVSPAPSWLNGWTASTSLTYCTDFLKNVTGSKTCIAENVGNIDEAIQSCVEDIQITGDTAYSTVHLQNFLSTCTKEIKKNMAYYKFTSDSSTGNMVLRLPTVLLKDICPSNCNGRGTCINGMCECRDNYVGTDCSDDKNKIPSLFELPEQGLCDIQQRACRVTPISGDYFIESNMIRCKIHIKKLMKNETITEMDLQIVKPDFEHSQRIFCPLPSVESLSSEDVVALNYKIVVSNDGSGYSDSLNLTVYDSVCSVCMPDLQCSLKCSNDTGDESTTVIITYGGSKTIIVVSVCVVAVIGVIVIITTVVVYLKKAKYRGKTSVSGSSVSVDKLVAAKTNNPLSTDFAVTEEYVGLNVAPLSTAFNLKKFRPKTGTRRNNQLDPLQLPKPASSVSKPAGEEVLGESKHSVSTSSTNLFQADENARADILPSSRSIDVKQI